MVDWLLDHYLTSTQRHVFILHWPSFTEELHVILNAGVVSPNKMPFLMLILVVLTIGATYAVAETSHARYDQVDIQELRQAMERRTEELFFRTVDESNLDSISFCLLLAFHHCYNGKQNRAL